MKSLKTYITESLTGSAQMHQHDMVETSIDSVLSRWNPSKRHEKWISSVRENLDVINSNIDKYKKEYHITPSTSYSNINSIALGIFKDVMGYSFEKDRKNNYTEDDLLFSSLSEFIGHFILSLGK